MRFKLYNTFDGGSDMISLYDAATPDERNAAGAAACDAARAAWDAARAAAGDAACDAARAAARAAWASTGDAAWDAAWDAARDAQEQQLRKMLEEGF